MKSDSISGFDNVTSTCLSSNWSQNVNGTNKKVVQKCRAEYTPCIRFLCMQFTIGASEMCIWARPKSGLHTSAMASRPTYHPVPMWVGLYVISFHDFNASIYIQPQSGFLFEVVVFFLFRSFWIWTFACEFRIGYIVEFEFVYLICEENKYPHTQHSHRHRHTVFTAFFCSFESNAR